MKILKYFMSLAMVAGLMASCSKDLEEVQTCAPEDVVAPSIHALDVNEVVITADNQTETLTFSWDAADYGAPTAINYAIMAAYNGTEVPVISGINEKEYAVTYEALNAVVSFDLGCPVNVASEIAFRIAASISSTYPTVYSEAITLKVTPTAAEKKYDMYYVIGSFNGWAHGTVAANYDFLYNFSGDGKIYEGIIDFREVGGAIEFKFTHGAAWGDGELSGAEGQTELEEPSAVTLVAGGGDNIFAYGANRYYHFSLDAAGLTLTMNYSFNTVGVVGTINDWGGSPDIEMTYNAQKRRFYADIDVAADGEIKFRADNTWGANEWGGADGVAAKGGANIAVPAGQYRVYLYLSESANMTYEISAEMYGVEGDGNTETPVVPTPPDQPVTPEKQDNLWEVIGNVNGTEWTDAACYMKEISEGVWFSPSFALAGEFKLRYNNDWNVNFGLTEGSDIALATPYVAAAGGANIAFPEGNYQVALYEETETIIVFALDGTGWGVVGSIASFGLAWNGDLMTYDEGGKLALKGVTLTTADEFKFREGQDWKNDRGFGALPAKNVYVDAAAGGANMKVAEDGVYDLYLDLTNEKIYVMAAGVDPATATYVEPTEKPDEPEQPAAPAPLDVELGVVGDHTSWNSDSMMEWNGALYVAKNVALEVGKGFKVRKAGAWDDAYNWGPSAVTEIAVGGSVDVVCGSGAQNINVPATGTYDVYFDYAGLKVWLMTAGAAAPEASTPVTPDQPDQPEQPSTGGVEIPADVTLGVVGDHTSWSTDSIMALENGYYVAKNVALEAGKGFKVRKAGAWDDAYNFGPSAGTEVAVNGSVEVINGSGSQNILVPATGNYDVYFDNHAMKVWLMEVGKTPAK